MTTEKKYESLLAIDPSIRSCGIAIFERNLLVYADVLRSMAVIQPMTSIQEICKLAQEAWEKNVGVSYSPEILVIERPEIYRASKGNPNDLMPICIMLGMMWERFGPKATMFPLPKEWKGQVPKEVHNTRILNKLDKRETMTVKDNLMRVPATLQHNAVDAIGLGLFALNRLGRRE